jgi:hypothetical protein
MTALVHVTEGAGACRNDADMTTEVIKFKKRKTIYKLIRRSERHEQMKFIRRILEPLPEKEVEDYFRRFNVKEGSR